MAAMNILRRAILIAASALLGVLAVSRAADAHGMIPRDVPVDRLITNLTKYIAEHPDDPEGYYRLGRVHTMALETKTGFVIAFGDRPAEGSWAKRDWEREKGQAPDPAQIKVHLTEAIQNLNKAIEMRPTAARYRLTLACALEAGETLLNEVDSWPLISAKASIKPDMADHYRELFRSSSTRPESLKSLLEQIDGSAEWYSDSRDFIMKLAYDARNDADYKAVVAKLRAADWHEQITTQFFTAMCLALPADSRATEKPLWGGMEDWASYEAGKNFIRLIDARKARPCDEIRMQVAKATVKAFDDLPRPSAITPIIFSLNRVATLADLLSPSASSTFDLDGSGRRTTWSWVAPDTSILVWDPQETGKITSGRQLFGSVSFWLFFDNGYQAMDTLDDNRDGELTGPELKGLAVWTDRNSNGVSDAGEVVPIAKTGIAALRVKATATTDKCPSNAAGLRMNDGRILPTYDWIASPLPSQPEKKAEAAPQQPHVLLDLDRVRDEPAPSPIRLFEAFRLAGAADPRKRLFIQNDQPIIISPTPPAPAASSPYAMRIYPSSGFHSNMPIYVGGNWPGLAPITRDFQQQRDITANFAELLKARPVAPPPNR